MDLSQISHSIAISILEKMLETETITEDQVRQFIKENPTNELRRITDLVHSLLCKGPHTPEHPEALYCPYTSEESYDTCWTRATHQAWIDKATELMWKLGLDSEADLLRAYQDTIPILQSLHTLYSKSVAAYQLARLLIEIVEF